MLGKREVGEQDKSGVSMEVTAQIINTNHNSSRCQRGHPKRKPHKSQEEPTGPLRRAVFESECSLSLRVQWWKGSPSGCVKQNKIPCGQLGAFGSPPRPGPLKWPARSGALCRYQAGREQQSVPGALAQKHIGGWNLGSGSSWKCLWTPRA